ncbi:RNA polymerase recycling motor ATPase HelR [Aeromicrobium sp. P5_D10]
MHSEHRAFNLPVRLAAKANPALIADDERHLNAVATTLEQTIEELSARLDTTRRTPGGIGQEAMDRDLEIHRLTARLRTLRRFGLDLCLGRMVTTTGDNIYVGRLGLSDNDGGRLLVDWRSPAAEPFFGATHARPMGLSSRRRYRWTHGRITDYWDEVFDLENASGHAALDDQSAFIASLGTERSAQMRDVLGTIQADQDAIIRASSRGTLVVDGGPGTGKTVVALHRAAYLLHADPRLNQRRGAVLFVGPHRPYLVYVADILPSLGEDGVQTCILHDLIAEGSAATIESDPDIAHLKSSARWVEAIEAAVRFWEEPPSEGMWVEIGSSEVWLSADDWAEAFQAPDPGTPHNEAPDAIWDELITILIDRYDGEEDVDDIRASLAADHDLRETLDRAWTKIEAPELIADLWSVPAYLRRCAPWLSQDEVLALQREDPRSWTESDLPLLDTTRHLLGDSGASLRTRKQAAVSADERRQMDRVIDELVQADGDAYGVGLVTMLRHEDLMSALVDDEALPGTPRDDLGGPFAHIIVDEAQELTDAQWQMLLMRCPARSFTIVGDRAQARHGFTESWTDRLERIGLDQITVASLNINYRTPAEVMAEAEPAIRTVLPDANAPTSIRRSGIAVKHGVTAELSSHLETWLGVHSEGTACVIGAPEFAPTERVNSLTPQLAKGLEFDLVILVDPDEFGDGIEGAVDRYVAMTRATQQLVILTSG